MQYSGKISLNTEVNLCSIIESGQTFLWEREDGNIFDDSTDNDGIYITARNQDNQVREIRVYQNYYKSINWESNMQDTGDYVRQVLDLDVDYNNVVSKIRQRDENGYISEALEKYPGLRVVREPLFPTIISFICSTQMRVGRIHSMVHSMAEKYGTESSNIDCYSFPKPKQLTNATKEDLKNLKLGYRASYVVKTVEKICGNDKYLNISQQRDSARSTLMELTGVGTKVADCILLYSGLSRSAVPVDTWIDKAVSNYYPQIEGETRDETAQNFERKFGDVAGYAQMYLFHYSRMSS